MRWLRSRTMRQALLCTFLCCLAALLASGCASTGRRAVAASTRRSALTSVPPVPLVSPSLSASAPVRLWAEPVGTVQSTVSGRSHLLVNIRGVLDPLTGSGARLPRGTRAVAVFAQIRNIEGPVYDSSATADFSLSVSGGLVTPLSVPRGRCRTPLEDFDRYITAGEDRVGCVAFTVSSTAKLVSVNFTARGRAARALHWRP